MHTPFPLAAIIDNDQIHAYVIESQMNSCQFARQIITFFSANEALSYFSAHQHSAARMLITLSYKIMVMY